jgi:hypothetical protein
MNAARSQSTKLTEAKAVGMSAVWGPLCVLLGELVHTRAIDPAEVLVRAARCFSARRNRTSNSEHRTSQRRTLDNCEA